MTGQDVPYLVACGVLFLWTALLMSYVGLLLSQRTKIRYTLSKYKMQNQKLMEQNDQYRYDLEDQRDVLASSKIYNGKNGNGRKQYMIHEEEFAP